MIKQEAKKIKILAIDDEKESLRTLKTKIRSAFPEADAYYALSGKQGIELAITENPDVILLDIVMPDMDGFEVCRLLKNESKTIDIPVVFVTALEAATENRIRCLEVGGEAFLSKPIDDSELIAQIKAMAKIKASNTRRNIEKKELASLIEEQNRELKTNYKATLNLLEDLRSENEARKKSEADLHKSEAVLSDIFKTVSEGMFHADLAGKILSINPALERIVDMPKEDIIGRNIIALLEENLTIENYQKAKQFLRKIIKGEKTIYLQLDYKNKILEVHGSINKITKRVTGVIRDVTEKKLAEQQIRMQKEQYDELVENITVGIYKLRMKADGQMCFEYVSPKMCEMGNIKAEDAYSDYMNMFRLIHPDELDSFVQQVNASRDSRDNFQWVGRAVVNNQIKWLQIESHPKLLENGDILNDGVIADITIQKKAEIDLIENELKYSTLVEQSPDGIFIVDISGKFLTVNEAMCNNLNYSEKEMLNLNIWDIVPEQYLAMHKERLKKILQGEKQTKAAEYKVQDKNGAEHDIEVLSAPYYRQNEIIGFQGIARDVTDRKRAEKALIHGEERYRLATQAGNVAAWQATPPDMSVDSGGAIENLIGYAKGEITDWYAVTHPDDRLRLEKLWADIFEGKTTRYDIEHRMIHKDESIRWVSIKGQVFNDDQGKILKVVGTTQDITVRKKADEELRESQEVFMRLFHESADPILMLDDKGFTDCNQAAIKILGYSSRHDIVDKMPWEISPEKQPDGRLSEEKAKALIMEALHKGYNRFEWTHKKSDGTEFPVEVMLTSIVISGKQAYYTIWRDITQRKKAEEELKAANIGFTNILESMSDAFVSLDRNWCYTHMNTKAGLIFNCNPEEMIGKNIWAEFPEGIDQPFHRNYQKVMDEKVFIKMEDYYPPYKKWFENRINPTDEGISIFFQDITERKNAEILLQNSEDKFRKAFTTSPDSININRLDSGMYIAVNNGFTRIMGYTEAEAIGKTSIEIDIWVNVSDRKKLLSGLRNGGFVDNMVAKFRTKSGEIKYGMMSASIIELGGIDHIISITRDITELRQTEEALRINEEKYRSIFENVQDVYYETHMDGTIIEVSPSIELISKGQYKRTDLIGRSMYDFYPDAGIRDSLIAAMLQKGSVGDFEVPLKNGDGSFIQCSLSVKIIFSENGQPEKIVGSLHDISERKKAENDLRESEEKFRKSLKNAPLPICYVDKDGNFTFRNERFIKVFGYDESVVSTINDWWLKAYPDEEYRKWVVNNWEAAVTEAAHKGTDIKSEEYKVTCNDGKVRDVVISGITINNDVLATFFDITDRKKAEQEIKNLNTELEQRVAERTYELTIANQELEEVNDIFVGREIRIIELKEELERLKDKLKM